MLTLEKKEISMMALEIWKKRLLFFIDDFFFFLAPGASFSQSLALPLLFSKQQKKIIIV